MNQDIILHVKVDINQFASIAKLMKDRRQLTGATKYSQVICLALEQLVQAYEYNEDGYVEFASTDKAKSWLIDNGFISL